MSTPKRRNSPSDTSFPSKSKHSWFRSWFLGSEHSSRRGQAIGRQSIRKELEHLEDRTAPAVINGTGADDELVINMQSNGDIIYTLNGVGPTTLTTPTELTFHGSGGDDLLTIHTNGHDIPVNGITYNGDGQTTSPMGDVLSINGTNHTQTATYTPHATIPGNGTVDIDGRTITFTGLEPVDISGMAVATLSLPGSDDVIDLANGFDTGTGSIPAIVATGTSGGVAIESAHFFNNTTVEIDTTGTVGNDAITITSASNAHANDNLIIDTGSGTDQVTVNGTATFADDITITTPTTVINAAGELNSTSGTGTIGIETDTLTVNAGAQISATATGRVEIDPLTGGRNIHFGNTTLGANLNLSDPEIDTITADVLQVGDATSGRILFSGTGNQGLITPANVDTVHLITGSFVSDGANNAAGGGIRVANLAIEANGFNGSDNRAIRINNFDNGVESRVDVFAASSTNGWIEFRDDNNVVTPTPGVGLTIGTVDGVVGVINSTNSGNGNRERININVTQGDIIIDDDMSSRRNLVVRAIGNQNQIVLNSGVTLTINEPNSTLSLRADNIDLEGNINATGRTVHLFPDDFGNRIHVGTGAVDVLNDDILEIDQAELDRITSGNVTIGLHNYGNANGSGPITVVGTTTLTNANNLRFRTNATVSQNAGATITETNLGINARGDVSLDEANAIASNVAIDLQTGAAATSGNIVFRNTDSDWNINSAAGVGNVLRTDNGDILVTSVGTVRIDEGTNNSLIEVEAETMGIGNGDITFNIGAGTVNGRDFVMNDATDGNNDKADMVADGDISINLLGTGDTRLILNDLAQMTAGGNILFDVLGSNNNARIALHGGSTITSGGTTDFVVRSNNGQIVTNDDDGPATVNSTNGTFTLQMDRWILDSSTVLNAAGQRMIVRPFANGDNIRPGDGGDAADGNLRLSQDEIDTITADVLQFGDNATYTGNIIISGDSVFNPAQVDTVHMQTAGNVSDDPSDHIDVQNLAITVPTGSVTLNDPDTDIDVLAIDADGSITVTDTDAINIGTVDGVAGLDSATAGITLSALAGGNIIMDDGVAASASGDIDFDASGSLQVSRIVTTSATATAIDINVAGVTDAGDTGGADIEATNPTAVVSITSSANIGSGVDDIETNVVNLVTDSTGGGSQWIDEFDGLSTIDLNAGAFNIDLTTGGTVIDGDAGPDIRAVTFTGTITGDFGAMGGGNNLIDTAVTNLNVDTSPTGNQWIDELNGLSTIDLDAGTGNVVLFAGGAIEDSDGSNDINATSVALQAMGGIGNLSPLQTTITNLAFDNTVSGDVNVTNSNIVSGLTVDSFGGLATSSNTGGAVTLRSMSPITYAVNTSSAGNQTAQAVESGTPNFDNVTVNAGVTVQSTGADVIFEAGDRINVTATAIVQATALGGDVTFDSAFGDTDNDGSMTLNGTINANATNGIVTLDVNAEAGATQIAGGTITGDQLLLSGTGAGGSFGLNLSATNDVDTLAVSTTANVRYQDSDDVAIGTVSATNGVNTTGNTFSLTAGAAVTQTQAILSAGLELLGAGPFTLDNTSNDVDTIAANTTEAISYCDTDDLTVGTVGTVGITTTDDNVTIVASENSAGNLILSTTIDLSLGGASAILRLQANNGAITQTGGNVLAETIGLRANAGNIVMTSAGNDVDTLAAFASGTFQFFDTDGFTVGGPVSSLGCFDSVNGITTTGNLSLCANTGNLVIAAPLSATTIGLEATAGSVSQTAAGSLTATNLGVVADTGIDLDEATNTVGGTVALNTSGAGAIEFSSSTGFTVGTVAAFDCFSGATNVQSADGPITLQGGGTINATNVTSSTDNDANDISITATSGNIVVTTINAGPSNGDVTLTANTGSITDDGNNGTVITADNVSLSAVNGAIGASLANYEIDLGAVSINTTTATGNGNQFLREADSVTIDATGMDAGTGTITLVSGTFIVGGDERIGDNSDVVLNGTLDLNDSTETIDALGGNGLVTNAMAGNATLIVGNNNGSDDFSGMMTDGSGTVNLTKIGSGTQTLSGNNSYTGATNIDVGTLELTGTLSGTGQDITLQNNTTLTGDAGGSTRAGSITDRRVVVPTGVTGATIEDLNDLTHVGDTAISVSGTVSIDNNDINDSTTGVEVTTTGNATLTGNLINNNPTGVDVDGGVASLDSTGASGANTVQAGTTGIDVSGASGDEGTVTLIGGAAAGSGNLLQNNTTGISVTNFGNIAVTNVNRIFGGTESLVVDGVNAEIANETLARTEFQGAADNYIRLANSAHRGPDLIDASASRFDVGSGLQTGAQMNNAQLVTLEDDFLEHFPDDENLGIVIYRTQYAYIDLTTGNLIVIGTPERGDRIYVDSTRPDRVTVRVNVALPNPMGGTTFDLQATGGRIVAFGMQNRDYMKITGNVVAEMFGNAGRDYMYGGGGNDVIHGGDDNDYLNGGNGDDVLLGENGADRLTGGNGNDMLLGNSTTLIYSELATDLSAWVNSLAFTFLSNPANYLTDGAVDRLYGGRDNDAFFQKTSDTATDRIGDFRSGDGIFPLA